MLSITCPRLGTDILSLLAQQVAGCADYAADLFTSTNPLVPALKTTERWFGPDHSVLHQAFLSTTSPPAQQDWQGWDVTFQVRISFSIYRG